MRSLLVLILFATPANAKPIALFVDTKVPSGIADQVITTLKHHGLTARGQAGPPSRCSTAVDEVRLCLTHSSVGPTLIAHRPRSLGGNGVPDGQRLDEEIESQVWDLWRRGRIARPIEAERRGQVSLEGGAFSPLPIRVPYTATPRALVVRLEGCPPFDGVLAPDANRLDLVCPGTRGSLVVSGQAIAMEVLVEIDGAERAAHLTPNEHLDLAIPLDAKRATVTCRADGYVWWRQTIRLSGHRDRRVTCAPVPRWQFVRFKSNVNAPKVFLDHEVRTTVVRLDDADDEPALPHPTLSTRELRAGQWAMVRVEQEGPHRLTIRSISHQKAHGDFDARPGSQARVEIQARPAQPRLHAITEAGSVEARRGLTDRRWSLNLAALTGAETGGSPSGLVDTMVARWFGQLGLGAAFSVHGNAADFGWGVGARALYAAETAGPARATAGLFFRQAGHPWATVGDTRRQLYGVDTHIYPLSLGPTQVQLGVEAGLTEQRARDFRGGRLETFADFSLHLAARVGVSLSW